MWPLSNCGTPGINSIAKQRGHLCGHLQTDIDGLYFAKNVYRGRLSFLNEQGQMNEAGSRMMRSGFLLCEAIVNLKPDWCESFVI
jgi:hypothetical protein